MADFFSSALSSADPSVAITSSTTLQDIIAATIGEPDHHSATTQPDSAATTQFFNVDALLDAQSSTPTTQRTQSATSGSPPEARFDDSLSALLDSPTHNSPVSKNSLVTQLRTLLRDESATQSLSKMLQLTTPHRPTPLTERETRLDDRFTTLRRTYSDRVHELSTFHRYQSAIVESERYSALLNNSDAYHHSIDQYYDNLRHQIIDRVETSVASLESTQLADPTNATTQFTNPTNASTQFTNATNASTQFTNATDATTQFANPTNATTQFADPTNATTQFINPTSASTQFTNPISASTQSTMQFTDPLKQLQEARVIRTRPTLSRKATHLMETWYNSNLEYPYPSPDTIARLATTGHVTEEQVKKWFANKRNRTRNVRPMSVISQRKRVLQQRHAPVRHVPIFW